MKTRSVDLTSLHRVQALKVWGSGLPAANSELAKTNRQEIKRQENSRLAVIIGDKYCISHIRGYTVLSL